MNLKSQQQLSFINMKEEDFSLSIDAITDQHLNKFAKVHSVHYYLFSDIPGSVGGKFALVSSLFTFIMYKINKWGWFNGILKSVFDTNKVSEEDKDIVRFTSSYRGFVYSYYRVNELEEKVNFHDSDIENAKIDFDACNEQVN